MRLVLDTNVVASAVLWGGVPRLLLQAGREKHVELFTSVELLAELTDILGRRKFDKKIAASTLTVDQLVDRYAALAALVSALAVAASTLSVSLDELFGFGHKARRSKRGPVPQQQQQQREAFAQLPKAKQRFVSEMLQTALAQAASR